MTNMGPYKIGVTGTRSGCTEFQKMQIEGFLTHVALIHDFVELHHGDCVGVDAEVAKMAEKIGIKIICHPPINPELRAYFKSDETREPYTYFKRNRNIVDECELLLVVPYQMEHQPNGGTWYTHDYAEKNDVSKIVFWPKDPIEEMFDEIL